MEALLVLLVFIIFCLSVVYLLRSEVPNQRTREVNTQSYHIQSMMADQNEIRALKDHIQRLKSENMRLERYTAQLIEETEMHRRVLPRLSSIANDRVVGHWVRKMIQIQELKEIVVALSSRSVVSKIRLATNKPGQGSKTSEHPTSDHQDIDVELLILNHFFKAFVDVSPEELEVPKHIVQLVVDDIFRHMQNALKPSEPTVAGEGPLKSGSVEEQLKVLDPDEFDYMFPIEMPHGVSLDFSFCHQRATFPKGSYGFGMIAVQTVPGDSQDRFLKSFVEGRFLQADKIKNWFKGKTQTWIDLYNENRRCDITAIKLSEIGAGVCLTIKYKDASFSVDLIPSVKVKERGDMYLIPKSCKKEIWAGYEQVKRNSLWRLSFSMYEMKLMNILTKSFPSSCHTDSLKIVKALRDLDVDNNPSSQLSSVLTSYHLKSMLLQILLRDLRRAPSRLEDKWSRTCLADRIKELLEVAQSSTRSKELHHVFLCNDLENLSLKGSDLHSLLEVPDWAVAPVDSGHVNLFSENFIDPNSLDQISARIKDIQEQWLNVIYRHVSPLSMKYIQD
ncbi:uncharacterized protein LOC117422823 [Acipenser ruthenus]|uniref:uncharacterized protein LOC117422823 n=1 Tax=Acipenser ruthenus TaxID=7906 RepID=UPI001560EDC6|nr:uncharacterized protein LOC117422823 [Acipenser ruthenus]XP_058845724.1 uncharacterized protein LOC117422823 [Acipenser ruthenus]